MDSDYSLFVSIVANGSLSAAARAIKLSPAMVSKRLARLEQRLGVQLIRRTTRRLELTDAGMHFHADVLAILGAVAAAEARLAGVRAAPAGILRVTAPTSFGRMHVAPHLRAFLDSYPDVSVHLDLSDEYSDLLGERIDLAIRITAAVDRTLVGYRLASSNRVLCASPDYVRQRGQPTSIQDLREHRVLAAGRQLPWHLTGNGRSTLFEAQSFVETNSSEVVRELALTGAGIALRSLWDVGRELADGRLVRVLHEYEGSTDVGVYAIHPRAAHVSPAVTAFVEHLRAMFSSLLSW